MTLSYRTIKISTHALREEGDGSPRATLLVPLKFLPTPSARRATGTPTMTLYPMRFLPTPSARRATSACAIIPPLYLFLPTPSARRATQQT